MKTIHFDNHRHGMLMFAPPDDKGSTAAPTTVQPDGGVVVPTVSATTKTESTVVQPSPDPGASRVLNATEALGLPKSPREEMDAMAKNLQAKTQSNIVPVTGKKKPAEAKKIDKPKDGSAAVIDAPPGKPVETVVKPGEAVAQPVVVAAAPEAKVKIGGKEYTPKEIEDLLAAKAAPAVTETPPAKPALKPGEKTPAAEPTKEQTESKERLKAFVDKQVADLNLEDYGLAITADELDAIVAGEAPGVAAMGNVLKRTIAAAQANAQQHTAAAQNALMKQLQPVIDHYHRIQEFQTETQILGGAKDIADNPKGRETLRAVADEVHAEYDRCQRMIAANVASDRDKQFAKDYETLGPDDFNAALVRNTRARLSLPEPGAIAAATAVVAKPAAATEPPAKPAAKTPPPPTGQNGGKPAPRRMDDQAEMARSLR